MVMVCFVSVTDRLILKTYAGTNDPITNSRNCFPTEKLNYTAFSSVSITILTVLKRILLWILLILFFISFAHKVRWAFASDTPSCS